MKIKRCKEKIFEGFHTRQCSRNAWEDGYCKQHHPDIKRGRKQMQEEKWRLESEERIKNSPWTKLAEAEKEIKKLKAEIERLKTT